MSNATEPDAGPRRLAATGVVAARSALPCCGATSHCCSMPPGVVVNTLTGCERCGHEVSCHAFWWNQP